MVKYVGNFEGISLKKIVHEVWVGNTVDGGNPANHLGCIKPWDIMGY